jgi:hypothetical protein
VVKQSQKYEKNILDAWYFKDELSESDTVIEAGQRSHKLSEQIPSCQITVQMYQLDVGSVFIYPDKVSIAEA